MDPFTATHSNLHEHICLTSDEWEEVEPTEVDAEVTQISGSTRRHVMIFNGAYLGVASTGCPSRPSWYWFHLAFLDPGPTRRLDRLGLFVTITLAVLGAIAVIVVSGASMSLGFEWTVTVTAAFAATLLGFGLAVRRGFDELVFYTRHGRAPVLRLSQRRADGGDIKEFVGALADSVRSAIKERSSSRSDYLRDEMMQHRQLMEKGVLNQKQFEAARALILSAHDK